MWILKSKISRNSVTHHTVTCWQSIEGELGVKCGIQLVFNVNGNSKFTLVTPKYWFRHLYSIVYQFWWIRESTVRFDHHELCFSWCITWWTTSYCQTVTTICSPCFPFVYCLAHHKVAHIHITNAHITVQDWNIFFNKYMLLIDILTGFIFRKSKKYTLTSTSYDDDEGVILMYWDRLTIRRLSEVNWYWMRVTLTTYTGKQVINTVLY